MTEERKKYLASISKEERVIREEITYKKSVIQVFKEYIFITNDDEIKKQIAETKLVIKALKKQLPAPKTKLELSTGVVFLATCPICKYPLASYRYCPICGQKLR